MVSNGMPPQSPGSSSSEHPRSFPPFDSEGGLILATHLPGSYEELYTSRMGWDDISHPPNARPIWIHLDRKKEHAQQWLRTKAGLDPHVVESLLTDETRPRAQAVGDGLLVILRGVNMNPGAEPDELITIRIFVELNRVISTRQYRFQTIVELRARAERGEAPPTTGAFLTAVAMGLAMRMNPTVENLEEMLDSIEDAMLERDTDDPAVRSQLATIRRQAITYRRHIVPQRDALLALITNPGALLSQRDLAELRMAAEHTTRIGESLEELRDRAAVTQEEMRARHEMRMGKTLYLLTLIATVALPLSILTGLLGINVGGIPLAESPVGFAVVCIVLVALAAGEVLLFKLMKWL